MANFISIEKEKRKGIIENKIDALNYLGLKNDRTRLIPYGISLGLSFPQNVVSKDSLYRPEYINHELRAMLIAATVGGLNDFENINETLSEEQVTMYTDACLNRGLDVIADRIDNAPEENHAFALINELDKLYSEIVDKK